MSWLHKLYETYEQCVRDSQFESDPLLPISHTTQKAQIEITVDGEGNFLRANMISKADQLTVVPCTENSGGRSGKKPVNHPLCDKLQYVAGDFMNFGGEVTSGFSRDPHEPHQNYLQTLASWDESPYGHPKLAAIRKYVQRSRVISDLSREQILFLDSQGKLLKTWEGDRQNPPPIFKLISKEQSPAEAFIRWRVEVLGDPQSATWEDQELMKAWIDYYASQQAKRGLCFVAGETNILAEQHPAKLRNGADKAKLISSNDNSGYTFRGRFEDADQACGVGFEVTQKAHNALRWLIERQGFRNGSQVIVSWAVSGKEIPDSFANSADLLGLETKKTGTEDQFQRDTGQTFASRLNKYIAGYRVTLGSTNDIVVMALDSATPGRMAITYYRELTGSDFLDRLQGWHEVFAWHQNYSSDLRFVGAPSPKDIAEAAYGRPKDDNLKKLHKATVERLLPCIIDGQAIPRDLMESTTRRTCNRSGLEIWEFEKYLGIACALFKGYLGERNYQMALETDRTTRDYLYGRLLAIAEHIEGRALHLAGEKRETNASRLMQRFSVRPYSTWRTIELALTPYKARLSTKRPSFLNAMEKCLDEINCKFQVNDFLDDQRLSGEFLLGYHCQRKALWENPGTEEEEEENNN
ncbi:MAG: type I-C CRISPR-associated protein Cas8c/Csd1 [Nitrospira sp.]|nr:type I-C CRISPR-associated protein Cas8c/Csd1 [Nitrospira sp.]